MPWEWPVGAACALVVTLLTTPAGVSGAVLLLPVQVSILGVPSPAVTPTNLLFNVAAVPGGLLRFAREGRLLNPLTLLLVIGSLPGVIVGSVIRVEWLSGEHSFLFVAAGVLLPLGLWLLLGAQRIAPREREVTGRVRAAICATALVVGTLGGIYGIGGGSLLAPLLLAVGFSAYTVAPATLTSTFLTSIVGIGAYQVLQVTHGGAIAPDWILGLWLGAGGFAGSYLGARWQRHVPEAALRRLLGLIACLVAARYLQDAARHTKERPAPSALVITATVGAVALLAGCGGGGGTSTSPTMTLDPHPPRAVAPGTTIEIQEDGPPRRAGDGMPPLRTAGAAREECAAAPALYVAWTYGVASRDLDVIARVIARQRAAPGMVAQVRAGCRQGLHRQGDRP